MTYRGDLIDALIVIDRIGPVFSNEELAHQLGKRKEAVNGILDTLHRERLMDARAATLADTHECVIRPERRSFQREVFDLIASGFDGTHEEAGEALGAPGYRVTNALQHLVKGGFLRRLVPPISSARIRTVTQKGFDAIAEARHAHTKALRESAVNTMDRDKLVRIGQQDRLALRRVLQAQMRIPYAQIEQEMARLGFPPVEVGA